MLLCLQIRLFGHSRHCSTLCILDSPHSQTFAFHTPHCPLIFYSFPLQLELCTVYFSLLIRTPLLTLHTLHTRFYFPHPTRWTVLFFLYIAHSTLYLLLSIFQTPNAHFTQYTHYYTPLDFLNLFLSSIFSNPFFPLHVFISLHFTVYVIYRIIFFPCNLHPIINISMLKVTTPSSPFFIFVFPTPHPFFFSMFLSRSTSCSTRNIYLYLPFFCSVHLLNVWIVHWFLNFISDFNTLPGFLIY